MKKKTKTFLKYFIYIIALIYLLSPIDILSDVIPFVGTIDDAVIIVLSYFFNEKVLRG